MAKKPYPELVFQKPHGPGVDQGRTFEDALRDLVRNSPYLGVSLLAHGIVFAIFFMMKTAPPVDDPSKTIVATPEEILEVLPPEPPPEPPEVEEIEEVIEEPVISEEVTEVTEVIDSLTMDTFDSISTNDVLGVGGGAAGGFSGKLGRRGGTGGGGKAEVKAVDDALRWLKFHQDPEGFWSASAFDDQCGQLGKDTICTGRGSPLHDVGVTGLALLAFLGAGHTDKEGRYQDTVNAGLKYLIKNQSRDGNFADPSHGSHTYDHIIATLAVTEIYAATERTKFKKATESALDYMYSLRSPGRAWRYGDKGSDEMLHRDSDTSVTGWAILVLSLARDFDIKIDNNALEDAMLFIEEVTDDQGRTGYTDRGGGPSRSPGADIIWKPELTESMTAVGVLCRIFVDPKMERPGNRDMIKKGVDLMMQLPISWNDSTDPGRIDLYYWYYATYAMYQWGSEDKAAWTKWEAGIKDILENQVKEGEMQGSWDPSVDPWSSSGGRVYSTAILALLLEVFYRYDTVMGSK